jgi:hypothetical protein
LKTILYSAKRGRRGTKGYPVHRYLWDEWIDETENLEKYLKMGRKETFSLLL